MTMEQSDGVREAIQRFYERFSAGDPDGFADILATGDGVSVIGSAPGEGHDEREAWIDSYARGMAGEMAGMRLEGDDPRGFEEGSTGWGVDTPAFVFPDGSRLSTRLTAVVHREGGEWKIVHLHFSVGVPDEDAIEPAE
jgi:hypothetical protein